MRRFFQVFSRLRRVFTARADLDFEQEIDGHLALLAERFQKQGMTAELAASAARRQFGNLTQLKEQQQEATGIPLLAATLRDLQFGVRQLRNQPGFSITAIAVLALGIGANTAIFSIVNGILMRPLPFKDPDKLVALFEKDVLDNDSPYNAVAPANFLDWQKQATTFEQIAATSFTSLNLASSSQQLTAERVDGCGASANLFDTLGTAPILGRSFSAEEDRPGGTPVAVISYGLWKRRFAGSAAVLSQYIKLNGKPRSIIGVMPANFGYPSRSVQVWIPLQQHLPPIVLEAHDNHVLSTTIGRTRTGATVDRARIEIDTLVKRYKHQHPAEVMGKGATVVPLGSFILKDIRGSLWLVFAAVGCVLLIACVNVANLLLTRALGRKREIAIRTAIGASRVRVIQQLLIESIVLSTLGSGMGLSVAWSLTSFLAAHIPNATWLPQTSQIQVDVWVFLFNLGLAILTGLLVGLFPAFQISRIDLASDLKDSSRTNTAGPQQKWFRDILVATEVALCVVLLIAAGLLMRSFGQLVSRNLGLRTSNTSVLRLSLPDSKYHERAQVSAFLKNLQDRLQSTPGVKDVGLLSCPLVSVPGYCPDTVFHIQGYPDTSTLTDAQYREVSPGFFAAAGVPMLQGRTFTEHDGIGLDDKNPHSGQIIVNEAFAKRFFRSQSAMGKWIQLNWFVGNNPRQTLLKYEVVGIAGDALERPDAAIQPTFYLPIFDGDSNDVDIVLHTAYAGTGISLQVQRIVRQLDPDLAVFGVQTVSQLVDDTIRGQKYMTLLFGIFAALAIVLATVGLYGVVSWGVVQRRNEIAVRMAIGASSGELLKLVLFGGLRPAVAGMMVGIPCSLAVLRLLRSHLFEIRPTDPITFVAVPLLLIAVASLASLVPAMRALRIDPVNGLRIE